MSALSGLARLAGATVLAAAGCGAEEASRAEGTPIEWVRLPAGSFLMGATGIPTGNGIETSGGDDARPAHTVTLRAFELTRSEVTYSQYEACVEAGACTPPASTFPCNGDRPWNTNVPVNCLSIEQAEAFAAFAGGRLPSEAEWEYAARGAGTARQYPWGDTIPDCDHAVFRDEAIGETSGPGCALLRPDDVCSRPRGNTPQGLCDMAGNVSEWCADTEHRGYSGAPEDGSAWVDGDGRVRVQRGGSYDTQWPLLGTRVRLFGGTNSDGNGGAFAGMRVARDASP